MRYSIVNLGCKVNRVEADELVTKLTDAGHVLVTEEQADLIAVNTCTVTGEADKKTRKAVRHALASNQHALLLVTGCAAAIDPQAYESMDPRVKVVPKAAFVTEALQMLSDLQRNASNCDHVVCSGTADNVLADDASYHFAESADLKGFLRTRQGVKVQDGCDNACTYCIVHVARGKAVSLPVAEVLSQVMQLAQAGVNEIVLSGIDLGSWRSEEDLGQTSGQQAGLSHLLTLLLEATSHCRPSNEPAVRFRIGSVEPMSVTEDLIRVISGAEGRICRHLHLPLQAGSSRVLGEMNRPYSAQEFIQLVDDMRQAIPGLALSTDIIVGFPGETEEDFSETMEVARRCGFMKIHVFPYSIRKGTPADVRKDQVAPEVKQDRARRLRALSSELAQADLLSRQGRSEFALVEGEGKATTESYHVVAVAESLPIGALVPVFSQE